MILVASEAALEGDAMELAVRETLRSHALVEPVRVAVEGAVERQGIDDGDAALMSALEGAVRTLRAGAPALAVTRPRDQKLNVEVLPVSAQSGVAVERGEDYNNITLRNSFRRRTHVWVSRVGYFDDAGNPVKLPAPVPVRDFGLSGTTALSFDNLVISVGDYLAELAKDIGFLGAYQSGNGWWNPVTSSPLALTVEPADAQASVYHARVVGIGAKDGEPMMGDEATKLEEIMGITLWEDICLPFVKTLMLPMFSKYMGDKYKPDFTQLSSALLLTATVDMAKMEVSGKLLPATVAALRTGNASEMLAQFWKEFFTSSTWKKLYETAMKAFMAATPVDVLPAILDGADAPVEVVEKRLIKQNLDKLSASLTKLARVVTVIKVATTAGDYAAMAKDWLASSRVDEFTVNVTKAKVGLTPNPLVAVAVSGTSGIAAVTASVAGLGAGFNADNVFLEWTCSGRYGDLFKRGGSGTNTFESVLSNPVHDYVPTGVADDPDAPDMIKVVAFHRNVNTNKRTELGSASVNVLFKREFNLGIVPGSGTDLPANENLRVTAIIQEELPPGTTVDWEWTHGGVGTLSDVPADNVVNDSAVNFDSGDSEGRATIGVRARIHLPEGKTTPARTVVANPVSTALNVKKGLKQLVMEVSGGVFGCGDPKACGVSAYTAFIVPRLANARSYSATLSGYAYPSCNRTVNWPQDGLQRDGGGCSFPVTYHPHTSAGKTNAYAVWIGFGGAFGGKCIVTITLAP